MAHSGVSPYRAVTNRWEEYAREHPKEVKITERIQFLDFQISRWSAHVEWTDRMCDKHGLGVNEHYFKALRGLARLERIKGALELKRKELRGW